jgi:hypothetical protein
MVSSCGIVDFLIDEFEFSTPWNKIRVQIKCCGQLDCKLVQNDWQNYFNDTFTIEPVAVA